MACISECISKARVGLMRRKFTGLILVLVMAVGAQAAIFDWNNGAGDGDLFNAANWTVTGGSTT